MGLDLKDGIQHIPRFHDSGTNKLNVPQTHFQPGFLAVLAAYINSQGLTQDDCSLPQDSYLKAVGFHKALWGQDQYEQQRINVGINYSMVTPLISADTVNEATTSINNCIRRLAYPSGAPYPSGLSAIAHVVGELHDNVWSHGRSTGFSFAQRNAVPRTNKTDHYLEFALADCGIGFLRELRRANISGINTHQEAIDWCIQEGNSSKNSSFIDDWAQQLPAGHIGGNVFGTSVPVREEQNNHQGLGLAHLMSLCSRYNGDLMLASGDKCLNLSGGEIGYISLSREWQGVAISCRFKLSCLSVEPEEDIDPELLAIMEQLRGAR